MNPEPGRLDDPPKAPSLRPSFLGLHPDPKNDSRPRTIGVRALIVCRGRTGSLNSFGYALNTARPSIAHGSNVEISAE